MAEKKETTKKATETTKKAAPKVAKEAAPKKAAPKKTTPKVEKEVVEKKVAKEEVAPKKVKKDEKVTKKAKPAKEKTKARAKEEKVETPVKPQVTEARAIAYNIRVTPRKTRLVVDLVRGKNVNEALGILANVNRSATPAVTKVIKSAAANAINNFSMDEESLYIDTIYVTDGFRLKRYRPRAKGSAAGIIKRTCHIYVTVKARQE